eukprot:TRINITY_DN27656_c0_g2_i1.p1 TRINITY_DN27656_c0_g2~~TRINITY_DN27656_c0_g2_i1.p1  ORF type:complete len:705 (+),score=153.09 TRINITY_DN27656_c0_g2_i1:41-2116(+)
MGAAQSLCRHGPAEQAAESAAEIDTTEQSGQGGSRRSRRQQRAEELETELRSHKERADALHREAEQLRQDNSLLDVQRKSMEEEMERMRKTGSPGNDCGGFRESVDPDQTIMLVSQVEELQRALAQKDDELVQALEDQRRHMEDELARLHEEGNPAVAGATSSSSSAPPPHLLAEQARHAAAELEELKHALAAKDEELQRALAAADTATSQEDLYAQLNEAQQALLKQQDCLAEAQEEARRLAAEKEAALAGSTNHPPGIEDELNQLRYELGSLETENSELRNSLKQVCSPDKTLSEATQWGEDKIPRLSESTQWEEEKYLIPKLTAAAAKPETLYADDQPVLTEDEKRSSDTFLAKLAALKLELGKDVLKDSNGIGSWDPPIGPKVTPAGNTPQRQTSGNMLSYRAPCSSVSTASERDPLKPRSLPNTGLAAFGYCPSCGNTYLSDAAFCRKCGLPKPKASAASSASNSKATTCLGEPLSSLEVSFGAEAPQSRGRVVPALSSMQAEPQALSAIHARPAAAPALAHTLASAFPAESQAQVRAATPSSTQASFVFQRPSASSSASVPTAQSLAYPDPGTAAFRQPSIVFQRPVAPSAGAHSRACSAPPQRPERCPSFPVAAHPPAQVQAQVPCYQVQAPSFPAHLSAQPRHSAAAAPGIGLGAAPSRVCIAPVLLPQTVPALVAPVPSKLY